jgi:hypothetical protein
VSLARRKGSALMRRTASGLPEAEAFHLSVEHQAVLLAMFGP